MNKIRLAVKSGKGSVMRVDAGKIFVTVGAGAATMAIAACATDRGDGAVSAAERGRTVAEASCAECHAVAGGAALSPNANAPTFQSFADRPDMTRTALAILLRTPHHSMPNLIVPAEDVDDLAAYLASLRAAG